MFLVQLHTHMTSPLSWHVAVFQWYIVSWSAQCSVCVCHGAWHYKWLAHDIIDSQSFFIVTELRGQWCLLLTAFYMLHRSAYKITLLNSPLRSIYAIKKVGNFHKWKTLLYNTDNYSEQKLHWFSGEETYNTGGDIFQSVLPAQSIHTFT